MNDEKEELRRIALSKSQENINSLIDLERIIKESEVNHLTCNGLTLLYFSNKGELCLEYKHPQGKNYRLIFQEMGEDIKEV